MADPEGLLDTSVVLLLPRLSDASLPAVAFISAVTLAEISAGQHLAADPIERARRAMEAQLVESAFDPLPFDRAAARAYGLVVASLRASGRKAAARGNDALIAAIAIANGLPLYTCDPDGFAAIADLVVRAVPHPDA